MGYNLGYCFEYATECVNIWGYGNYQKPLIEDNPLDPRNRRITLILLNQTLPDTIFNDEEMGIGEEKLLDGSEMLNYKGTAQINPYRKTPGTIEFP